MKVRMMTSIAGEPSHYYGEVVDLAPNVAKAWIFEGMAVAVDARETASREPTGDRAVKHTGKVKGR